MDNFKKLISDIQNGTLFNESLDSNKLIDLGLAIKFRQKMIDEAKDDSLGIGDNVNWYSKKDDKNRTGFVVSKTAKVATVRTIQGVVKVSISLLTKIDD
jgi:hypothetical protein